MRRGKNIVRPYLGCSVTSVKFLSLCLREAHTRATKRDAKRRKNEETEFKLRQHSCEK